jgi:hypothetical protein
METHDVILISCESDDWEGIYVDGFLLDEGHSLSNSHFISLIRTYKNFNSIEQKWITDEGMDEVGCSFPTQYNDIPKKYLL